MIPVVEQGGMDVRGMAYDWPERETSSMGSSSSHSGLQLLQVDLLNCAVAYRTLIILHVLENVPPEIFLCFSPSAALLSDIRICYVSDADLCRSQAETIGGPRRDGKKKSDRVGLPGI